MFISRELHSGAAHGHVSSFNSLSALVTLGGGGNKSEGFRGCLTLQGCSILHGNKQVNKSSTFMSTPKHPGPQSGR